MTQINISMKQKQTHRYREQTCGCQGERGRGEKYWEFGISRCKLLYARWINNKVLLYSTGKLYSISNKLMKKNIYMYS